VTVNKATLDSDHQKLEEDGTRPSVNKGVNWLTNCPHTCDIDRFSNAPGGNIFTIMGDDGGRTTILDVSSGSTIYINGGSNVTLADGELMFCIHNGETGYTSCMT